jgi:hypothetical protein
MGLQIPKSGPEVGRYRCARAESAPTEVAPRGPAGAGLAVIASHGSKSGGVMVETADVTAKALALGAWEAVGAGSRHRGCQAVCQPPRQVSAVRHFHGACRREFSLAPDSLVLVFAEHISNASKAG